MKFTAYDNAGKVLLEEVYFSVGGGTIARQDEISRRSSASLIMFPISLTAARN